MEAVQESDPKVAVISGSTSDSEYVAETERYLGYFGVSYSSRVLSAHRAPDEVAKFAKSAADSGYKVLIAEAGMAAHLAGVLAAHTHLPVIGVPLPGSALRGEDALHSTVQMPAGVPVATMAIGKPGAANAAVLAVEILAVGDESLAAKLRQFKADGCKIS